MWDEFFRRENVSLWRMPKGTLVSTIDPLPKGVLPGSFDPLHEGHRELREVAESWLGGAVHYEMTIANADKPPLAGPEIERRIGQFDRHPVWITNAATFAEKARLLPGMVFIMGADTAERIVQPRFYGGSKSTMWAALDQIRQSGCRFLVAGRLWEGQFLTATGIAIPPGFEDLFETLPETQFRRDVSSTELRRKKEC